MPCKIEKNILLLILFGVTHTLAFAQRSNELGMKKYTYRASTNSTSLRTPPAPPALQPQMQWVQYTPFEPDAKLITANEGNAKPKVEKNKSVFGIFKKAKTKKSKKEEELVADRDSNPDAPIESLETAVKAPVKVESTESTAYLKQVKTLVDSARICIGTPYKTGGTDKTGMDCSGLVVTMYKKIGKSLPRRSIDMSTTGTDITDVKNIKVGDLVFFDSNNAGKINHVGMITKVTDKEVTFIHASVSQGVMESSLTGKYWKERHKKTVRVL